MIFIFLALVIFTSIGMIYNTAVATRNKVRAQTAADAAAYSAAVWMSRGMNQVAFSNMMITRNLGAEAAAFAAAATPWFVIAEWADFIASCTLAAPVCAGIVGAELPFLIEFAAETVDEWRLPMVPDPDESKHFESFLDGTEQLDPLYGALDAVKDAVDVDPYDLMDELPIVGPYAQRAWAAWHHARFWVDNIGDVVNEQTEKLEGLYGADLHVTQRFSPGQTVDVQLPVKWGGFASLMYANLARWRFHDNGSDGWSRDGNFRMINQGNGPEWYDRIGITTLFLGSFRHWGGHYVLSTVNAPDFEDPVERSPQSHADWRRFSVLATAKYNGISNGRLFAPSIFKSTVSHDDQVLAFAQAETFNGMEQTIHDGATSLISNVVGPFADILDWIDLSNVIEDHEDQWTALIPPTPFRLWTPMGMQWEPRLNRAEHLWDALEHDLEVRNQFAEVGFSTNGGYTDVLFNH